MAKLFLPLLLGPDLCRFQLFNAAEDAMTLSGLYGIAKTTFLFFICVLSATVTLSWGKSDDTKSNTDASGQNGIAMTTILPFSWLLSLSEVVPCQQIWPCQSLRLHDTSFSLSSDVFHGNLSLGRIFVCLNPRVFVLSFLARTLS